MHSNPSTLTLSVKPDPTQPDIRKAIIVRFLRPTRLGRNLDKWTEFSLLAVLLLVAIPTLLVWRFVPKFPRGHCRRCGYNLTGLTEARCPECGAGFASDREV